MFLFQFSAKLARIQNKTPRPYPDPNALPPNIYRRVRIFLYFQKHATHSRPACHPLPVMERQVKVEVVAADLYKAGQVALMAATQQMELEASPPKLTWVQFSNPKDSSDILTKCLVPMPKVADPCLKSCHIAVGKGLNWMLNHRWPCTHSSYFCSASQFQSTSIKHMLNIFLNWDH